jgi:hypothetical protein
LVVSSKNNSVKCLYHIRYNRNLLTNDIKDNLNIANLFSMANYEKEILGTISKKGL